MKPFRALQFACSHLVVQPVGTTYLLVKSAPLSPIFSLFLAPFGKLYLKVHHLLAEDELVQRSTLPLLKHRRPGPKHPKYGLPAEHWPTVVHRVVDLKEPLRRVAAAYGVS